MEKEKATHIEVEMGFHPFQRIFTGNQANEKHIRQVHNLRVQNDAIVHFGFDLDAPVKRIAAEDAPVPYHPLLEKAILPTKEKIFNAMKNLLEY